MRISADPLSRTTVAGWAVAMVNTLLEHGVDRGVIWGDLGWSGDELAREKSGRVPTESVLRLWRLGERHVGEHFGLSVAGLVNPKTFDLLGASIWYSRNLRDAFGRIAKYSHLIHRTGRVVLHPRGVTFELRFLMRSEERDLAPDIAIHAFVASLCVIVRQIHFASTNPLSVELQRPAPGCVDRFEKLFRGSVVFGAANNTLSFPLDIMDEPLPGSHPAFACEIDRMIEKHLLEFGIIDTRFLVTAKILERMRSGDLSLAGIAQEMGITARYLQFLLAGDGASYGTLLRDLRKEMAVAWLEDSSLTIRDVGASLGFAEASSFARAFRDWFGVAPAEYRRKFSHSRSDVHYARPKRCA